MLLEYFFVNSLDLLRKLIDFVLNIFPEIPEIQ